MKTVSPLNAIWVRERRMANALARLWRAVRNDAQSDVVEVDGGYVVRLTGLRMGHAASCTWLCEMRDMLESENAKIERLLGLHVLKGGAQ